MLDALIRWAADPFGSQRRRLARIRAGPFPPAWNDVLEGLAFYRALPAEDQRTLREHILLFCHDKHFEGCGGLELTEKIILTIAAHACLLVLRRSDALYPALASVLVYPNTYVARHLDPHGPRRITREQAAQLGASWTSGTVILSWHAVENGHRHPRDGHNVALHEFAHQLDQENGPVDGAPGLGGSADAAARLGHHRRWQAVMKKEYAALREAIEEGREHLLDPYGATAPAEFFAVATETFFERPHELRKRHPELHEQLQAYYRLDPADWNWS
ncbi:MAG: zinc-dependent peptidase [Opitutales bacterium]